MAHNEVFQDAWKVLGMHAVGRDGVFPQPRGVQHWDPAALH